MGRQRSAGSILLGLTWLAMIVVVWPSVKPAVESFAATVLGVTSVTGGLEHFIISTMPWWGLMAGIAGALAIIIWGSKGNEN